MSSLLTGSLLLAVAAAHAGGTVELRTTPTGAAVRVDGTPSPQLSPTTLSLPAGRHHIAAALGCERGEATVDVVEGRATPLTLSLTRAMGTVTFLPEPPEMQITVDGSPVSRTDRPVQLPCGEHRVKATLPGATPVVLSLDVGPDQSLSLPIVLEQRGVGSISVAVQPVTAVVSLDGTEVGTGDQLLAEVPEGPHQVAVRAPGHATHTENLVLGAGELRELRFELAPTGGAPAPDRGRPSLGRIAGWSSIGLGTGLLAVAGAQYLALNLVKAPLARLSSTSTNATRF